MNFIDPAAAVISEDASIPGFRGFRDEVFGVLSFDPASISKDITDEDRLNLRTLFDPSPFWITI